VEVEGHQLQNLVVEEEEVEEAYRHYLCQEEEVVEEVTHKLRDYYTYFAPFNHTIALDLKAFPILRHSSEEHRVHATYLLEAKPFHLYRVQPNLIRRPCSRIQALHKDAW
jgi:hypothetical protein